MPEPELPKPIYPPSSPGGGAGNWGAPTGVPGVPAPPVEPPPAGTGGFGGYGTGGGPGGFPPGPPSSAGKGKGPVIAIAAIVVVVVLGVIGVVVANGGDDDKKPTTELPTGDGSKRTVPTDSGETSSPRVTETAPTSEGGEATALASRIFAGLSSNTIDCLADEFEQSDDVVAQIRDDQVVAIDDPDVAAEYASIVVGCTDTQELSAMLQGLLTSSRVDPTAANCILTNAQSFGTTQWEEFITASVQPSESSSVIQLLDQLAVC